MKLEFYRTEDKVHSVYMRSVALCYVHSPSEYSGMSLWHTQAEWTEKEIQVVTHNMSWMLYYENKPKQF
jgi:hypothetical protein